MSIIEGFDLEGSKVQHLYTVIGVVIKSQAGVKILKFIYIYET